MILLLDFSVSRHQPPRVSIADAYWSFRPVAHAGVDAFFHAAPCSLREAAGAALCARLRLAAERMRAAAETPVRGMEVFA